MLRITATVAIPLSEIGFTAIRAEGPGGQHVNRTSSAVQIRFDIEASSLPDEMKRRLRARRDHRITAAGVIIIKVQDERSLTRNKETALERLADLIRRTIVVPKKRKPTKPTKSSVEKRIAGKKKRGETKRLRRLPAD
ncbi:MAG TPA: alternative ribosome rescue aminoacyl-tRNA hydrolase ArfB [bacterium]|nr:alternative ribosome rescue aminoacyl-tRNA hydrolase ArfB [bacterium]